MNNSMGWIKQRLQIGRVMLGLGILLSLVGAALPGMVPSVSFNTRVITGLGILCIGIGIAFLVRYGAARRDPKAASRIAVEEHDERTQFLRQRAGNRAYLASAGLAYALLMWVSFSANGSLPTLSQDSLWLALAGLVVIPAAIYIGSMLVDEKRM